jgi:hypothetical protein
MDPERGVNELEADLRATAEDIAADAGELKTIETRKATMPAGDPRLLDLAKKADELGDKIAAKTSGELALAKDATGAG